MKIFDIDKLVASLQGYIETKIELLKLDAKDEFQALLSKLFLIVILGCSAFLSIIFLSMALASLLSSLYGNAALAYLTVGALYIIIAVVIYAYRYRVLASINKSIEENE